MTEQFPEPPRLLSAQIEPRRVVAPWSSPPGWGPTVASIHCHLCRSFGETDARTDDVAQAAPH